MDTLAVTGITVDMLVKWQETLEEEILILDSRPFISYNEGHIVTATNVHCPPILKRRSGGFVALENIVPCGQKREKLENGEFRKIIVYDEDTTDLELSAKDSNLYSVLKSLRQQIDSIEVDELCYIKGLYVIPKLNKLVIFNDCPLLWRAGSTFTSFKLTFPGTNRRYFCVLENTLVVKYRSICKRNLLLLLRVNPPFPTLLDLYPLITRPLC